MKGVYCTLHYLVFSSLLIFYAQTIELAYGTSQLKVDKQNDPTSNWVPMPSDIGQLKEERLLATIKSAQKKLVNTPKDATAWGQLGNIYFVHGWKVEAAQCYQVAIENVPDTFRWLYYLGLTTYMVEPKSAAQTLAKAITLNPKYAPAHIYRAAAVRSLGQLEQAKSHLEEAKNLDPKNPYASLWLGEIALVFQQFEVARAHLTTALELNPEQSEAHAAMAKLERALGQIENANRHAEASKKRTKHTEMHDPLWLDVLEFGVTAQKYAVRGNRYLQQGDFKRAISELKIAILDLDNDPHLWLNYGIALLLNKQYSKAVAVLEKTLLIIQDHKDTVRNPTENTNLKLQSYYNLGLAYYQEGRTEKSVIAYQQAIQLEPNFADAYGGLGLIYWRTGNLDTAILHCQKAIKIAPENIEFHQNLVRVYWQKGMYDSAAEVYRTILDLNASDTESLHHLGLILLSKNEYHQAVSYFQQVLEIKPENALTHGALGVAYYKLGEQHLAIHQFQEVLRLDPQNQNAHKMLERLLD